VNVIDLGQYAKNRDVVMQVNVKLSLLCEKVLRTNLPKPNHIRISVWSRRELTKEQLDYAAKDAIVSLDIYHKLCTMTDLSLRLDSEDSKVEGLAVDLVPPHARSSRESIMAGYGHSHDLTTRAGVGKIIRSRGLVRMPENIKPERVRHDGRTTCRIVVTKTLASALLIPNFKKRRPDGTEQRACLGDFGPPPFEIVVPLSMLRKHVPTDKVRLFGGIRLSELPVIGPSRTPPAQMHVREEAEIEDLAEMEEAEIEELGDGLTPENVDPAREVTMESMLQSAGQDVEALEGDANHTRTRDNLEAMRQAEILADRAQFENEFKQLWCAELGPMPDIVRNVFIRGSW
jgi:hypothetical protein